MSELSTATRTRSRLPIFLGVAALLLGGAAGGYLYFGRGASPEEAKRNVRRLAEAAVAYARERKSELRLPQSSSDWTPEGVACHQSGKRFPADPAAWDPPPWSELHFSVEGASAYQYRIVRTGEAARQRLIVEARADLDCNGVFSRYAISVAPDLTVGELVVEREGE